MGKAKVEVYLQYVRESRCTTKSVYHLGLALVQTGETNAGGEMQRYKQVSVQLLKQSTMQSSAFGMHYIRSHRFVQVVLLNLSFSSVLSFSLTTVDNVKTTSLRLKSSV